MIRASLKKVVSLHGSLSGTSQLNARLSPSPKEVMPDVYQGEYEVIPGETVVILDTKSKSMTSSVTIHPIPSNYGLIEWDGVKLRIS